MTKENQSKADKMVSGDIIFPPNPESSRLLIGCSYDDYMASRIARAVEDADARLLNLNVTAMDIEGYQVVVALRVNHRNAGAVARSLERYGYGIIDIEEPGEEEAHLRERYDQLMRFLSM